MLSSSSCYTCFLGTTIFIEPETVDALGYDAEVDSLNDQLDDIGRAFHESGNSPRVRSPQDSIVDSADEFGDEFGDAPRAGS